MKEGARRSATSGRFGASAADGCFMWKPRRPPATHAGVWSDPQPSRISLHALQAAQPLSPSCMVHGFVTYKMKWVQLPGAGDVPLVSLAPCARRA